MSDTTAGLRSKISSAADLQSVVRTMKALAASNMGQYEKSTHALSGYSRAVELGLGVCLRESARAAPMNETEERHVQGTTGIVVFGSDQGLVGQFNTVVTEHAIRSLAAKRTKARVWAVGERVHAQLAEAGIPPTGTFAVPNSVNGITELVGQILLASQYSHGQPEISELYLCYNRSASRASYVPVTQRLLPLDESWSTRLIGVRWPTDMPPEILGGARTLTALIREYLFVSLFRACADSLASENASRLAAMERAERNIDELLKNLSGAFHRLRQQDIDEELFDVIAGYEALSSPKDEEATRARP